MGIVIIFVIGIGDTIFSGKATPAHRAFLSKTDMKLQAYNHSRDA